jgi:hypothetical protein
MRFNAYVPLKSSAHAGLASPRETPTATTAAVNPRFTIIVPFPAVVSIFSDAWDLRSTRTPMPSIRALGVVIGLCESNDARMSGARRVQSGGRK